MSRLRLSNHIIICGWSEMVRDVISQLHAEEVANPRHVVIIDDRLEVCPVDDPFVYFVKGDPTQTATLEHANLGEASAAIILADWSLPDPTLRDSKTALITLAIESTNSAVYSCAEVMNTESKRHLERAGVDEPICVSDLSEKMLLQAALNHGISRFFDDVLTFGEGSEIYKTAVPQPLIGKTFREAVKQLSDRFGVILMSVEREESRAAATSPAARGGEAAPNAASHGLLPKQSPGRLQIHTNPQNEFALQDGDMLFVLAEAGEVLTRLQEAAAWVSNGKPAEHTGDIPPKV